MAWHFTLQRCMKLPFLREPLNFNPFPNKHWFSRVCSTSLLKTLWEKEKLLVAKIFSFFRSVFYPFQAFSVIFLEFKTVVCKLFQFGRVWNLSFGKELSQSVLSNSLSDCEHSACFCENIFNNVKYVDKRFFMLKKPIKNKTELM